MRPQCKRRSPAIAALARVLTTLSVSVALHAEVTAGQTTDVVFTAIQKYCVDCHNQEERTGQLALDAQELRSVAEHAEVWEKVVRKLQTRQMPPPSAVRPDDATYDALLKALEKALDESAAAKPNPGRTETLRRLTRAQYQNAVRDLLGLELDLRQVLPADESVHGFDQGTVANLSPTALDRYLSAAEKISRLAVGTVGAEPSADIVRIPADLTQEEHVPNLPLGTRGGAVIPYVFPVEGEFEIQIRLARDRNEEVEGLREPHELDILLDRRPLHRFVVAPPEGGKGHEHVDAHLKLRASFPAGLHQLGVTFVKKPSSLLETKRQPYQAHFNMHRHPRISPAVFQISITGPFNSSGPGDTPSRRLLFAVRPTKAEENEACARQILSRVVQRAYRRQVVEADLREPLKRFADGCQQAGFDAGIQSALSAILVSPHFLWRIESEPDDLPPGRIYRISDVQLASRLSFFLWNSIPDDLLLESAFSGELQQRAVLEAHLRRMLADPRSKTLATHFASQWLHLRNLESMTPDARLFPDFDENLRRSLREETELQFDRLVREDRSLLELLKCDSTYLDERLAKHYGIPHVFGSRMRRVQLDPTDPRGGLLRQASILTVTSYATRTSPVIRGKWVLENLLGTPPPPAPANVPALPENSVAANLAVRERLAAHRANAACAGCHNLMDPVGFALENFDAVGRWRSVEDGKVLDVAGGLPDGRTCVGVAQLEEALFERPEVFLTTVAEKLLTYALGREMEYYDAPAIREIVRQTRAREDRFSALILEIVSSAPFQMRRAE